MEQLWNYGKFVTGILDYIQVSELKALTQDYTCKKSQAVTSLIWGRNNVSKYEGKRVSISHISGCL